MVELSLLKLCLSKEGWLSATSQGLSTKDFPKELQTFFSVLSTFHAVNDSTLTVDDLANLVFSATNKDKEFNLGILDNLKSLDVSDSTSQTLLHSLLRQRKLKEISLAAYEAYEGKIEFSAIQEMASKLTEEIVVQDDEDEFVTDNFEELVNRAVNTPGLEWRLLTLNQMLGPLRKGNAGFLFARPESGKTTLLGSEISFMAEQADNPVLWFANEDEGDVVMLRIIQGYFGITMEALLSNLSYWQTEYKKKMDGKIRLLAAGTIHANKIEKLCEKYKPSLLVCDQLAHVAGFNDDKKNLALGKAFRWWREMAKEYAPAIAVHQAGGEGEGVKWLTMNHVDEVKTAAQAHADWILGVGKSNQDGYESIRFLHLSKNKLMGGQHTIPALRHGKKEVLIKPEICRYEDLF